MELTDEIAKDLWRGETYRIINRYLAGETYDDYHVKETTLDYVDHYFRIIDVIKRLNLMMVPFGTFKKRTGITQNKFYRGDKRSILSEMTYNKETFISVTYDFETAVAFCEDGVIFHVTIDDNVNVTKTGIESELLIEPNSCCNFIGSTSIDTNDGPIRAINIHITNYSDSFPNYSDLMKTLVSDVEMIENEISDHFKDLSILSTQIKDSLEFFNVSEDENYSIDNFAEELILFRIDYNHKDLESLFGFYLSLKEE